MPRFSITQRDAADAAVPLCAREPAHDQLLPILFRRTRIRQRGSVVLEHGDGPRRQAFFNPPIDGGDLGPTTGQRMARYATEALPLAEAAAAQALDRASVAGHSLTHLITVSCTGFAAPGVDVGLVGRLGLSPSIARTQLGFMGCHGALAGLRLARSIALAEPSALTMVCAVELCSLHFQYGWDPARVIANALFADGAAAAIVGSDASDTSAASTETDAWRLAASSCVLLPDSLDDIVWQVGDHGFQMRLSARVPALLAERLPAWLTEWLDAEGLHPREVAAWAIHPGGPRILDAVAEGLGLPASVTAMSREILAERGNMSSPTLLFILERMRAAGVRGPCVALAFGPGVTVEGLLLR